MVASGPSASGTPLSIAKGRAKVIVVNDCWKLCPWADVLFAGDYKWWEINEGCPEFQGIKVSIDRRACETQEWGIYRVRGYRSDNRISFDPGVLGGGNSGFNTLNLAVQFQATRILLVGFDMRLDYGVHWHGLHPEELKNPIVGTVERWRRAMDDAAEILKRKGITVINCSQFSALKCYPKMDFSEALCRALSC